ncbi:MAG TPA: lamin tail domain-containing protein [Sedimentisphaerales bacterium]|jgi:hypothetical protein|nr:lamin tail domain-containing protein [Sedimentisphaerales bacterium]HNU30121.1 lamin tail domain-containing protein [Sedimentisphaerales bacterium]
MRVLSRCRWRLFGFIFMMILGSAGSGSALVISEIMYHPAEDAVTADEPLEFIEIYNNRAVSEDLSNWAFTNGIEYTFDPNTTLGPKSYMVIARDPNALSTAYGITGVLGPYAGKLNNDGERIELSNAAGMIVLSVRYNDAHPWPVSPDGTGHSLVLAKLGGDPDQASSWSPSTYLGGTPGQPDKMQAVQEDPTMVTLVQIGTNGRYFKGTQEPSPSASGQATTAWTQIGFNDAATGWLQGANGYGYSNSAAELAYINTVLADMSGNYISIYARLPFTLTASQLASFTQLLAEVHYDDGYVLYLNGTRVADSGTMSGNPPAYNASGGTATEPEVATVDLTAYRNLLVEGTNILAIQAHNATLSGSSDAFGCPILRGVIVQSEADENVSARLLINELQANSDAAPGVDWIELYNPGPIAVSLNHIYLSDNRLNLLQYKIPNGVMLRPGQFWTVQQGAESSGFPFGLASSGETVYLTAATSDAQPTPVRVLDAMRYGNLEPDVTFGRCPDGADSLDCLASATFGTSNSDRLIRDIVINEIMYHHASREEQYEYVELYNRGENQVSLGGWAFTDGIEYTFPDGATIAPDGYLVVAKDPNFLAVVYDNLVVGENLLGPYEGGLDDRSERIRLSYPLKQAGESVEEHYVTVDEVTYHDGGRWPSWADGMGASLELRDPRSNNDTPDAWADSDESGKTQWQQFSFTIPSTDNRYTHSTVSIFDFMLLNAGEVLLDDLQCVVGGTNRISNNGFESGETSWRILGNHTRSFVTTEDRVSGSCALHLIATGHGDPGANRINQSITSVNATSVTFSGWARWLRGSRFLLLRTSRPQSPVMPPWPSHAFELSMPLDLGTPGRQNTAFVHNRGPDILDVQHSPTLPTAGESIVVTARVVDNDGVASVTLRYRVEGVTTTFFTAPMVDDGSGLDEVAGDHVYTYAITGATAGRIYAFYIEATDGAASTRFPTKLASSAEVPERTCLVRVGDTKSTSRLANYRIWMSNDVMSAFQARANLSNELLDCTFVYNDTDVFYNCGIRLRGSPFLRSGSGWTPQVGRGLRIEFPADRTFRGREEINLDWTEGNDRGPLQERASYWFYAQLGLQHSRQEWVRLFVNGNRLNNFEDVQKIDGDYIDAWFPENNEGYIHKIDDYFEYSADGTQYSNIDEGLLYNSSHPLIPETYRWHFEKRSHPQNDTWQHLYGLAMALNTSSTSPLYEKLVEAQMDPAHFAKMLALRHAVGDWDSYGYTRGKNNALYYALPEGKWYLLPWDIDFTLGSGNGSSTSLFSVGGQFPEVSQFLNYAKYKQMYYDAFRELVNGPWKTSYGTNNPPTPFDIFLDEGADLLTSEGLGDGRRNGIKQFVRDRRTFILSQIPDKDDTPRR